MLIPAFLLVAFFVKNETVRGIIGNTQGVSNATNPPRKPRKKRRNNPVDLVSESMVAEVPQSVWGLLISIDGINILFLVSEIPAALKTILSFCSSGINSSLAV